MQFDSFVSRNAAGVCNNMYQGDAKRVLTICSAACLRSPTAAVVLNQEYGYDTQTTEYMSGDMQEIAAKHIALLNKADMLVTVDFKQKPFFHKNFVVLNFGEKASTYYNKCRECHK